jgi:hypothetical protein
MGGKKNRTFLPTHCSTELKTWKHKIWHQHTPLVNHQHNIPYALNNTIPTKTSKPSTQHTLFITTFNKHLGWIFKYLQLVILSLGLSCENCNRGPICYAIVIWRPSSAIQINSRYILPPTCASPHTLRNLIHKWFNVSIQNCCA